MAKVVNYISVRQIKTYNKMAFLLDKVSEDTFYENMLLGVTKILEKNYRIKNVTLERRPACLLSEVCAWEQMHCIKLPDELRDFYLAVNGFKLVWNYVFSEQEILQVGFMHVNAITELIPLTGYKIWSTVEAKTKTNKDKKSLILTHESKVFQLTDIYSEDDAKVCLIYANSRATPQFWLADEELNWFFLASGFKKYFLMSIAHLGLPMWQYCFTDEGIPAWAEQVFMMVAPHLPVALPAVRPEVKEEEEERKRPRRNLLRNLQNQFINKLDLSVFKPKIPMRHKTRVHTTTHQFTYHSPRNYVLSYQYKQSTHRTQHVHADHHPTIRTHHHNQHHFIHSQTIVHPHPDLVRFSKRKH